MREGPILFSDEMARQIWLDFKTQTRRVIDFNLVNRFDPPRGKEDVAAGYPFVQMDDGEHVSAVKLCPYGQPGDRLWVRESVQIYGHWQRSGFTASGRPRWRFRAHDSRQVRYSGDFVAQPAKKEAFGFWTRPSIFMPRWASRITLQITDIRVERLQDISEEDAMAEGVTISDSHISVAALFKENRPDLPWVSPAQQAYCELWESVNAKRGYSWDSNPWVWVVEFKRMK